MSLLTNDRFQSATAQNSEKKLTAIVDQARYPLLDRLVRKVVESWPEHTRFIASSFEGRDANTLQTCEKLSWVVERLATIVPGGMDRLCSDYRFLCEEIVMPEEIHFRRHGTYRLSSFEDAERECYANAAFMDRYMNGLLLSDILWVNHARAFDHFVNNYLPNLAPSTVHLEIGTGHGIFLYFASQDPDIGEVHGWDVSETSIKNTSAALEALEVQKPVKMTLQNLFDADQAPAGGQFDSIVMSEILEHLEDPLAALQSVSKWLKPGGAIYG